MCESVFAESFGLFRILPTDFILLKYPLGGLLFGVGQIVYPLSSLIPIRLLV